MRRYRQSAPDASKQPLIVHDTKHAAAGGRTSLILTGCVVLATMADAGQSRLWAARATRAGEPTKKERERFQEIQAFEEEAEFDSRDLAVIEKIATYQIGRLVSPRNRSRVAETREAMPRSVRRAMRGAGNTGVFLDLYARAILKASVPRLRKAPLVVRLNLLILWEQFATEDMTDDACAMLADPKVHEAVKYWAVKLLGKLGDRRAGSGFALLANENLAVKTILELAATHTKNPLHYKTLVQICQSLGRIGRSDRAVRDEAVADVLRAMALDRQQHMEVRAGAATALSLLRVTADVPHDYVQTCNAEVAVLLDVCQAALRAKDRLARLILAEQALLAFEALSRMPEVVKQRARVLSTRADRPTVAAELAKLTWVRKQLQAGVKLASAATQYVVTLYTTTRARKKLVTASDKLSQWQKQLLLGPVKKAPRKAKAPATGASKKAK